MKTPAKGAALVLLRLYGKLNQRSLFIALLKRLPRAPFRKAGAKVLHVFLPTKHFSIFFQNIPKKELFVGKRMPIIGVFPLKK
jgi:hypothetical protein